MSDAPQHTPGPWSLGTSYGLHGVTIEAANGRAVCGVIAVTKMAYDKGGERAHEVGTPDGWANARLISACPDMFDALRRARDFVSLKSPGSGLLECIDAALNKSGHSAGQKETEG